MTGNIFKQPYTKRFVQVIALIILIFPWTLVSNAQSMAEIRNVDFSVRNDSLFVQYDLDKAGKQERFYISLKITSSSGKIITPYTLSGDVGANIPGGKTKQIVWNISKDNLVINEEISVEVIATPKEYNETITTPGENAGKPVKFVSRGKAVLLSAFVPGLGLLKLNKGGPYWIMAIVVYGSAAGSYLYYSFADQNYEKYLDAQTESERNSLHSTVQSQQTISNVLMYTAAAVWLGNMIWTLASPNKTKPRNKGISLGGAYDPWAKAPVFTFTYKF